VRTLGIDDRFIEHGTPAQLYSLCGYDSDGIERVIYEMIEK
jgi:1-deoxy-D-xylulose-5-phosphate synthase